MPKVPVTGTNSVQPINFKEKQNLMRNYIIHIGQNFQLSWYKSEYFRGVTSM